MKQWTTRRLYKNLYLARVTFSDPIEDTDEIVAIEPHERVIDIEKVNKLIEKFERAMEDTGLIFNNWCEFKKELGL